MASTWVGLEKEIPEAEQSPWLGITYGIWVKDGPLEIWLAALGQTIDESEDAPAWLETLRAGWCDGPQPAGCVHTGLAEHVVDDERAATLRRHVVHTIERLLDHRGDYFSAFSATRQCKDLAPHSRAPLQLTAKLGLIEVGAAFARLLSNDIRSGEHSSFAWGWGPQ